LSESAAHILLDSLGWFQRDHPDAAVVHDHGLDAQTSNQFPEATVWASRGREEQRS